MDERKKTQIKGLFFVILKKQKNILKGHDMIHKRVLNK